MSQLDSIPFLGGGIGYRPELHHEILAAKNNIDFLEIIAERYAYGAKQALYNLSEISERYTVIPHGVSLSIGTCQLPSKSHLAKIKKIIEITNAPYFSEHLAVTQCPGIELGHLSPICFNDVVLEHVIENIDHVQSFLNVPLVLENITFTHKIPGSTMTQEEFFNEICRRTGCGLLLDITNLYTNSVNWNTNLEGQLDSFPINHLVQVHLAGGFWSGGKLVDSHSEAIPKQVWQLFYSLLEMTSIKAAIVERDSNFPEFSELLNEVTHIRNALNKAHQPSQ
ncbi:DUF692 domain-containing protein [Microbulbifer sp. ZKSA004]|uniref:DUF692 domain-containing protein n=1 Tax=Microbulbifer sp. ZKSA004 TaxID=3243389 RepID=UPI004039FC8E